MEEIVAKLQTDGASSAMQKLLLVLPVRHESWFDQLIHAMKCGGYRLIVDAIYRNGAIIIFLFAMNFTCTVAY